MKNRLKQNPLLNDVLGADAECRELALTRSLGTARRRRIRRLVGRTSLAATAALIAVAFLCMQSPPNNTLREPQQLASINNSAVIPGTPIRVIGDDELLALFANQPAGLVGTPGKRRLVLFGEHSLESDQSTEMESAPNEAVQ